MNSKEKSKVEENLVDEKPKVRPHWIVINDYILTVTF
jgi:hypothetical protein